MIDGRIAQLTERPKYLPEPVELTTHPLRDVWLLRGDKWDRTEEAVAWEDLNANTGAMRKHRPHYIVSLMLCHIQLMTTITHQKGLRATALSFCQLLIPFCLLCWKTTRPLFGSWSQASHQLSDTPIKPNVSTLDGCPNSSEESTTFLLTVAPPSKLLISLPNPLPMPISGGTLSVCSATGSSNPTQGQQRRLPPRQHLRTLNRTEPEIKRVIIEICCGEDSLFGRVDGPYGSDCHVIRITEKVDLNSYKTQRDILDVARGFAKRGCPWCGSAFPALVDRRGRL